MEVHATPVSGSFQNLDSKSSALSKATKADQRHTINSDTVESGTDSRISSIANNCMNSYQVFHDKKTNTTFVVKKGFIRKMSTSVREGGTISA